MEKGFNTDLEVQGGVYHVQTEDWGKYNPYLVSRIFKNGAVVKSIKTGYGEVLPSGKTSSTKLIKLAMKVQHNKILDLLVDGKLL